MGDSCDWCGEPFTEARPCGDFYHCHRGSCEETTLRERMKSDLIPVAAYELIKRAGFDLEAEGGSSWSMASYALKHPRVLKMLRDYGF